MKKHTNLLATLVIIFSTMSAYAEIPDQYVTANGTVYKLVKDAPKELGAAYQDSEGLIWGDLSGGVNEYGAQVEVSTYSLASKLCSKIKMNGRSARLPTLEEMGRVQISMEKKPGDIWSMDFTRPALPNLRSYFSYWTTSKTYFDFPQPEDNTDACVVEVDGYSQYHNGAGVFFPHRCVVETDQYVPPALVRRCAVTTAMLQATPPQGALQPPFNRPGHIENVKYLLRNPDSLTSAYLASIFQTIGDRQYNYYSSPNEENFGNINLNLWQFNKAAVGGFYTLADINQTLDQLKDQIHLVRTSTLALEDSSTAQFILQKFELFEKKVDILKSEINLILDRAEPLVNQVKTIPHTAPMSDPRVIQLWSDYKPLKAATRNLQRYAGELTLLINDIKNRIGPAIDYGQ